MALVITPGPLPENYARADSSSFLETFVNQTTVRNFSFSNFDIDLTFISSQTDQPSATRGHLWFQRGQGQLRFLDDPDRGDSRYTNTTFMCICPRREIMVEAAHTNFISSDPTTRIPALGVAVPRFPPNPEVLFQYYRDVNLRQTIKSDPYFTPGVSKSMHTAWLMTDTPVSGYPMRVVEWGFTPARMACGVSSVAGANLKVRALGGPGGEIYSSAWHSRSATWVGETFFFNYGVVAHTTGLTNSPYINVVFKRPVCEFWWYV